MGRAAIRRWTKCDFSSDLNFQRRIKIAVESDRRIFCNYCDSLNQHNLILLNKRGSKNICRKISKGEKAEFFIAQIAFNFLTIELYIYELFLVTLLLFNIK